MIINKQKFARISSATFTNVRHITQRIKVFFIPKEKSKYFFIEKRNRIKLTYTNFYD